MKLKTAKYCYLAVFLRSKPLKMVEAAGFEPTVSSTRNWRDTTFATPRFVKKLLNFVVVSYVVNPEF